MLRQLTRLVDLVSEGEKSRSILDRLHALEREAESAQRALSAAEKDAAAPVKLPAPEEMMRLLFDLEARLLADVSRGREELRRLFRDGRIDLVPQPGGFYVARSEILPLVVLMSPPPKGSPEERYTASSCAGRI
jgi:hypothetical protein